MRLDACEFKNYTYGVETTPLRTATLSYPWANGTCNCLPETCKLLISLTFFFAAGVVDQDYRGNVGVVLFNFGQNDFEGWLFCICFTSAAQVQQVQIQGKQMF